MKNRKGEGVTLDALRKRLRDLGTVSVSVFQCPVSEKRFPRTDAVCSVELVRTAAGTCYRRVGFRGDSAAEASRMADLLGTLIRKQELSFESDTWIREPAYYHSNAVLWVSAVLEIIRKGQLSKFHDARLCSWWMFKSTENIQSTGPLLVGTIAEWSPQGFKDCIPDGFKPSSKDAWKAWITCELKDFATASVEALDVILGSPQGTEAALHHSDDFRHVVFNEKEYTSSRGKEGTSGWLREGL